MESSKSLSFFVFVVLLLAVILFPLSSATFMDGLGLARSSFPSIQAKRLIKDLNLFPEHDVNVIESADSIASAAESKKIVEKRFRMPNLVESGGVSVDDLGHHAGYYKIEHSHAARSVLSNAGVLVF